ncbi:MAG: hypothetical protein CL908_15790 [Deltaproteobacteria bacterium]|jgi:hypothetical protein|nr:hypothetical protein [Deltaproteobacteria bacterium]
MSTGLVVQPGMGPFILVRRGALLRLVRTAAGGFEGDTIERSQRTGSRTMAARTFEALHHDDLSRLHDRLRAVGPPS